MYKLKIFSYIPNPRVWKAVIAGKICGVEVEVIGDNHLNLVHGFGTLTLRFWMKKKKPPIMNMLGKAKEVFREFYIKQTHF